jgi:hypothetical protein
MRHFCLRKRQHCKSSSTVISSNKFSMLTTIWAFRYSKLESSGSLQTFLHNANLSATRPFIEDDIRNSIDLLKSSTAAIHRQTTILRSQREDLQKELRNDRDARLDQDRTLAHLLKRHRFQKQHITTAVLSLCQLKRGAVTLTIAG